MRRWPRIGAAPGIALTVCAWTWLAGEPAALAAPMPAAVTEAEAPDAEDEGGSDADFDFGPEPAATTPQAAPPPPPPRRWALTGIVRSEEALWAERIGDNPFAKARQSLDLAFGYKWSSVRLLASLHGEWDAAYLVERSSYDEATLDTYETLTQIRETYVATSLGPVELTVGRQIVAFGEGDALSPLDLCNPRDLREPGLADLVDVRVPVLATRIGYFRRNHRFELMWVHEAHFGFRVPPMGPFSPLPAALDEASGPLGVDALALLAGKELRYAHRQDAFAWENQQFLLRWVRRGEGIDLGVVAGSVLDQQGVIRGLDMTALALPASKRIDVPLDHLRYEVVGTTGAWAVGSVLLKWELAMQRGRPISTLDSSAAIPVLGSTRSDAVDAMIGVTWRGISNTTLGLEVGKTTLLSSVPDMLFPVDAPIAVLRAQHSALRERLELTGVAMAFGETAQYGWLARAEASYLLRDGLRAGLGYVTYQPGDEFGPFAGLDRHDRAMARVRWDFAL